jgi:hypothetical protein
MSTYSINSNSTKAWVDLAGQSYQNMEKAGAIIRNEITKDTPNIKKISEQQEVIQKATRAHEMATNMLQTIHNILKKVIEKLQIQ